MGRAAHGGGGCSAMVDRPAADQQSNSPDFGDSSGGMLLISLCSAFMCCLISFANLHIVPQCLHEYIFCFNPGTETFS